MARLELDGPEGGPRVLVVNAAPFLDGGDADGDDSTQPAGPVLPLEVEHVPEKSSGTDSRRTWKRAMAVVAVIFIVVLSLALSKATNITAEPGDCGPGANTAPSRLQ